MRQLGSSSAVNGSPALSGLIRARLLRSGCSVARASSWPTWGRLSPVALPSCSSRSSALRSSGTGGGSGGVHLEHPFNLVLHIASKRASGDVASGGLHFSLKAHQAGSHKASPGNKSAILAKETVGIFGV